MYITWVGIEERERERDGEREIHFSFRVPFVFSMNPELERNQE